MFVFATKKKKKRKKVTAHIVKKVTKSDITMVIIIV